MCSWCAESFSRWNSVMQQNETCSASQRSPLECRPLRTSNNFPCHQLFCCHLSFRQMKGTLVSVTVGRNLSKLHSLYSLLHKWPFYVPFFIAEKFIFTFVFLRFKIYNHYKYLKLCQTFVYS